MILIKKCSSGIIPNPGIIRKGKAMAGKVILTNFLYSALIWYSSRPYEISHQMQKIIDAAIIFRVVRLGGYLII